MSGKLRLKKNGTHFCDQAKLGKVTCHVTMLLFIGCYLKPHK